MYSINLNKYWTLFYTKQSKLEFDVLYAVLSLLPHLLAVLYVDVLCAVLSMLPQLLAVLYVDA